MGRMRAIQNQDFLRHFAAKFFFRPAGEKASWAPPHDSAVTQLMS